MRRRLFCPICATDIEWRVNDFRCGIGVPFSAQLGNSIKNAVFRVEPASGEQRKPSLAPYLWCPNCTAELAVKPGELDNFRALTTAQQAVLFFVGVTLGQRRCQHPDAGYMESFER